MCIISAQFYQFQPNNFAKINIIFYSHETCKGAMLIYFVYKANLFISTMNMPYIVGFSCLINARKFVKMKVLMEYLTGRPKLQLNAVVI